MVPWQSGIWLESDEWRGINPCRDLGSEKKALEVEYTDSGNGVSRRGATYRD
jgi:hypothetical protein